jgi:hypothetical protein
MALRSGRAGLAREYAACPKSSLRADGAVFFDSNMEVHAIMKYGISSLLGPGLMGALLLGSGCALYIEGTMDDDDAPTDLQLVIDLSLPSGLACTVASGGQDRACGGSIESSGQATVAATVEWGARAPGFIDMSDDCGGTFELVSSDQVSMKTEWTPPSTEGTCVIWARAVAADGVDALLSVTVEVQSGGPGPYPRVSGKLSHSTGTCLLQAGQTEVVCSEPVLAGDFIQASVDIDWGNLSAIQYGVSSACGGESAEPVNDGSTFQAAWLAPLIDNPGCWVTFEAITLEGPMTIATLYYSVVDGQPRGEVYAYVYFEHAGGQCYLNPGAFSSDCAPAAAGEKTLVYVEVDWGNYRAGPITVSDTCNGSLTNTFSSETNKEFDWVLPPVATPCTVQVEAVTADGELNVFEMNIPIN